MQINVDGLARSAYRDRVADLRHLFDGPGMMKNYTDEAHISEPGQQVMAAGLVQPVVGMLTATARPQHEAQRLSSDALTRFPSI